VTTEYEKTKAFDLVGQMRKQLRFRSVTNCVGGEMFSGYIVDTSGAQVIRTSSQNTSPRHSNTARQKKNSCIGCRGEAFLIGVAGKATILFWNASLLYRFKKAPPDSERLSIQSIFTNCV